MAICVVICICVLLLVMYYLMKLILLLKYDTRRVRVECNNSIIWKTTMACSDFAFRLFKEMFRMHGARNRYVRYLRRS